jgi:hypothetical protein
VSEFITDVHSIILTRSEKGNKKDEPMTTRTGTGHRWAAQKDLSPLKKKLFAFPKSKGHCKTRSEMNEWTIDK